MNLSPIFGDIESAGTAPNRKGSGSAVEQSLESQAFEGIVREQLWIAERATTALAPGAYESAGQLQRDKAQELRDGRRRSAHRASVVPDNEPVTTGVAGGSPLSPVEEASKSLATPPSKNDQASQDHRPPLERRSSTALNSAGSHTGAGTPGTDMVSSPASSASETKPIAAGRPESPVNNVPIATLNQRGLNSQSTADIKTPSGGTSLSELSRVTANQSKQTTTPSLLAGQRQAPDLALRSLIGSAAKTSGPSHTISSRNQRAAESRPAVFVEQPPEAQVARGLAQVLRHKGGSVTLKLNPEALGEVRVQLKLHGSDVAATLYASNDAARDTLSKASESLKKSLESHGLRVTDLRVVGPDSTLHAGPAADQTGGSFGANADSSGGQSDSSGERTPPRENAGAFGPPYAEGAVPHTPTDFGCAFVGGRFVIDTVA